MKQILLVNASPRGEIRSASQYFSDALMGMLDTKQLQVSQAALAATKQADMPALYQSVLAADSIVLILPLYVDALPSTVLSFLVELAQYARQNQLSGRRPAFYAVINCGFFEGEQNRPALSVLRNFCQREGFIWRFGCALGGGEFLSNPSLPLENPPKHTTHAALSAIAEDLITDDKSPCEDRYATPTIPRILYSLGGTMGWRSMAKSHGLPFRALYAKPYRKRK